MKRCHPFTIKPPAAKRPTALSDCRGARQNRRTLSGFGKGPQRVAQAVEAAEDPVPQHPPDHQITGAEGDHDHHDQGEREPRGAVNQADLRLDVVARVLEFFARGIEEAGGDQRVFLCQGLYSESVDEAGGFVGQHLVPIVGPVDHQVLRLRIMSILTMLQEVA